MQEIRDFIERREYPIILIPTYVQYSWHKIKISHESNGQKSVDAKNSETMISADLLRRGKVLQKSTKRAQNEGGEASKDNRVSGRSRVEGIPRVP